MHFGEVDYCDDIFHEDTAPVDALEVFDELFAGVDLGILMAEVAARQRTHRLDAHFVEECGVELVLWLSLHARRDPYDRVFRELRTDVAEADGAVFRALYEHFFVFGCLKV